VTGCDAAGTRGCFCVEEPRAKGSYSTRRRDPPRPPSQHHPEHRPGTRGARIINVSFTGPRDPSIERRRAQARQQE